jgi:hypothetical protein
VSSTTQQMASLFVPPSTICLPEFNLSSKAMQCALSISVWSGRKHDPNASEEIATLHHADSKAGRYNKLLLDRKALEEIQKIVSEARKEHAFLTLPWDDNGYRVLPAAAYFDHTEKMRDIRARFDAAVATLEGKFEALVGDANRWLGTLFQVDDYPGITMEFGRPKLSFPNELRDKFSFETKVMPLPNANDFRVSLGDEEKERVRRQIAVQVQAQLQVASRDLWQRLYDAVAHMSERLQAYKETEKGIEHPFRDTLVTNLVKLVDILPKLNVTQDLELERLAGDVRSSLIVDPERLRQSTVVRTETANAAAAIANKMAEYMNGFVPDTNKAVAA